MTWLAYLLKVSVSLALFYAVYRLVFSRLTFFRINRFYLLGSLVLSAVLPLLRLPAGGDFVFHAELTFGIDWDAFIPMPAVELNGAGQPRSFSPLFLFLSGYLTVSFILLAYRILRLVQLVRRYRFGDQIEDGKYRWVIHPGVVSPFTLFRTIYMDPECFRKMDPVIAGHEKVHAAELHTVDLLFAEMMIAFLWFNPLVFLFRRHIRENHEFLADRLALLQSKGLPEYMAAITAELTRRFDPAFASYFRSSTIKKRIIMLTNKRTNSKIRWIYLVFIPMVVLLFLAFQQPVEVPVFQQDHQKLLTGASSAVSKSVDGIPSGFPLDERHRSSITASFGKEMKNPFTGKQVVHQGVDIMAPTGTPVYATGDGVVASVEDKEGYGKLVVVRHDQQFVTFYAHLDQFRVTKDDRVEQGTVIGTVGNTGYSTGPHLHYEVRKAGERVDPADYY